MSKEISGDATVVPSVLTAVAMEKIWSEVEMELEIPDPLDETAKAVLEEAISKTRTFGHLAE